MKVLVTGHDGYVGSVLTPMLAERGHDVHGLDSLLYTGCDFGCPPKAIATRIKDIRDVEKKDLVGFDAVIHLAAISNDPLGDLNPACTESINLHGTIHMAKMARDARVSRFIHASTCSVYGSSGEALLDESAPFNPVTPYGWAKERAEQALAELATADFSPTYLRSGTAYGSSPRLRGDLVINNLLGWAVTTGMVRLKSDGSPWRPVVHVSDIALAFATTLEASRKVVHNQAYNVGRRDDNFRIRELANLIQQVVPDSQISFAEGAGPDIRNYRVNCAKIAEQIPAFKPQWDLEAGIRTLFTDFKRFSLKNKLFEENPFFRNRHVMALQSQGRLDEMMRWVQTEEKQASC
ncbi:MAG: NAD(P)-dependent oxidoreductase [Magnetococcales bacterium]|nr:NAD(P)-dependent oxidoreductase [Magnetococcales bacterium]